MELDFAILADGVSGRPDGKLDIYGATWDTISSPAVPALHPRLTLAARVFISRNEAERKHDLDVVLQGEDGTELARAQGPVDPLPAEARDSIPAGRKIGIGLVLNFENVVFPEFGPYQLVVLWDGNELRALPLYLETDPV